MKKLLLPAVLAFLVACGDDNDPPEYTEDMQSLLDTSKDFSMDSVIYLADTVKFVDMLVQEVDFGDRDNPWLSYSVNAVSSAINVGLWVTPNSDGGFIKVKCRPDQDKDIVFNEPKFPATVDGYKLKFKSSLKVRDTKYHDVLEFKAPDSLENICNIRAFYYGVHDGLVKVVSRNGVELSRVPAKVYEDAEDRRASERARADSLAQVVADSIAQAVADSVAKAIADSIVKANEIDSTDSDSDELLQDALDIAETVADCIKKAYSAGSLTAIKDCKI